MGLIKVRGKLNVGLGNFGDFGGLMTVPVLAVFMYSCLVKLSFLTRTFSKMYVFSSSTCLLVPRILS